MHVSFFPEAELFGIGLGRADDRVSAETTLPIINTIGFTAQPKLTATVLAGEGNLPFLVTQLVGAGQVIYQAADETYRWRSYRGTDAIFNQYWTSLIGSVSRLTRQSRIMPSVAVKTRESVFVNEDIELALDLSNQGIDLNGLEELTVKVKGMASGAEQIVALKRSSSSGLYRGTVQLNQPDRYVISKFDPDERFAMAIAGSFSVVELRNEKTIEGPNIEELRQLAVQQNGVVNRIDEWESAIANLPNDRTLHFEPLEPQSIWNYPLLVGFIIGVLGTEWYLRNRWGLL